MNMYNTYRQNETSKQTIKYLKGKFYTHAMTSSVFFFLFSLVPLYGVSIDALAKHYLVNIVNGFEDLFGWIIVLDENLRFYYLPLGNVFLINTLQYLKTSCETALMKVIVLYGQWFIGLCCFFLLIHLSVQYHSWMAEFLIILGFFIFWFCIVCCAQEMKSLYGVVVILISGGILFGLVGMLFLEELLELKLQIIVLLSNADIEQISGMYEASHLKVVKLVKVYIILLHLFLNFIGLYLFKMENKKLLPTLN